MKTICLYSEEFPPETNYGGISIYNHNLANTLSNNGFKVVILTKSLTSSYISEHENILIYRIKPYFSRINFLRKLIGFRLASFFCFLKLYRKHSFSLVETPEWKADAFFLFIFKSLIIKCPPLIVRLHGCRSLIRHVEKQKCTFADNVVIYMEKYIMKKANYISSTSISCLKKTEECTNLSLRNKTKIIYNSTNIPTINAPTRYSSDPRIILFVGRIELLKGVFSLATVMVNILKEHNNIKLIFVGRDIIDQRLGLSTSKLLKDIIGEINMTKVTFAGQLDRDSLNELYKKAYCTILPSFYETFGLCCIESMKYGTPVIGSKNGGMGEIITDGVDSFLIDPENIGELEEKILFLLANPSIRDKFSIEGVAKINKKFSNSFIFNNINEFYHEIIESRK